MSVIKEYALTLSQLEGDAFELEVCARLQSVILDFQTVPAKPQGDGGLDGFSHAGEHGYCCYGPEHDAFKTPKQRTAAIVKKFKEDLLRLCELELKKKVHICIDNAELGTILPKGRRLKHIRLIVSWFESHQLLSPLLSEFEAYKALSKCRYIAADATLVVWGPKELANQHAVDQATILRARQRIFAVQVEKAAQGLSIDDPKEFHEKMELLRQIRPDRLGAVNALSQRLVESWKMALAFERELLETLPQHHHTLEVARKHILTKVSMWMIESLEPWTELTKASGMSKEIIEKEFLELCGNVVEDVSMGEIARLIGECPIGWEKTVQHD